MSSFLRLTRSIRANCSFRAAQSTNLCSPTWKRSFHRLPLPKYHHAIFRRHLSYNYSQPYNPNSRSKKWLANLTLIAGLTGLAYLLWWPKHTFPSPVAKILRKGLWAESDKGDHDFELALKYYIEALQKCDELHLDTLSDEYTGVQLKVAEMYERLNMFDEANFVYNEIATLYLKTLTDSSVKLPEKLRDHFIQKDLRVVMKLVELNKSNLTLSKAIIITHSILPNMVIEEHLGSKISQLKVEDLDDDRIRTRAGLAFLPFLDEYINIMDMLVAITLSLGDYNHSINLNLSLNKLMMIVRYQSDKILLNQCNLGSLLYLQSQLYELDIVKILKKYNLDYKQTRLEQYLNNEELETSDRQAYSQLHSNFTKCIDLAVEAYLNVGKIATNLINNKLLDLEDDELNTITELDALATYSLGVIYLHVGDYAKSERYLRESRVKSKNCNYVDLIQEIENELVKLFEEKKKFASTLQ